MSNKKRVSLWKAESKKGTVYLTGTDKDSGLRWYVFKDNKNPDARNLVTKPLGNNDASFENIETLAKHTKDETGEVFFTGGDFFVGENIFYYENEEDAEKGGVRYMTRKDGSTVVGRNGEPLEKNSHVLLISNV
jgi:hypothetical protein